MKKNIAICVYGLHPDKCWKNIRKRKTNSVPKYFKQNLIDCNKDDNVDVFIHSFSYDYKNKIINEYNPTKYIIEKQRTFDKKYNCKELDELYKKNYQMDWHSLAKCILYGMKTSVSIMHQYEKDTNTKYDIVLLMRSDLLWMRPLVFRNHDNEKFYASSWGTNNTFTINNKPTGMSAIWHMSNPALIDKLVELYDKLDKYIDDGIYMSMHTISRHHIETFTKVTFEHNDVGTCYGDWNKIIDCDLQRYLVGYKILLV